MNNVGKINEGQTASLRRERLHQYGKEYQAMIVANAGDPGIQEDYAYDVLSRFVIALILPTEKFLVTYLDFIKNIVLVKRPEHLWIKPQQPLLQTQGSLQRVDTDNHVNIGNAGSYSTDNIPQINRPYRLGEIITIKRITSPLYLNNEFFNSYFTYDSVSDKLYTNSQNLALDGNSSSALRNLSVYPYVVPYFDFNYKNNISYNDRKKSSIDAVPISNSPSQMPLSLWLDQFEDTMLQECRTDNLPNRSYSMFDNLSYLYGRSLNAPSTTHAQWKKRYLDFKGQHQKIIFNTLAYEDVNLDNKARIKDSCSPLIVAAPQSFPTPTQKTLNTFTFNPTFVKIS